MNRLVNLTFTALLLTLVSCNSTVQKDTDNVNSPSGSKDTVYNEMVNDLLFKIELNKKAFSLKDEIVVHVKLTNTSNEEIAYYAGSSSCVSHLGISIILPNTTIHLADKPIDEPQGCTDDIHEEVLGPNETVEEQAVFIPKLDIDSSKEPASSGTYEVVASFRPVSRDWNDDPIQVKTSIVIHGKDDDDKIMTREVAEEIAKHNQQVNDWIHNHTGDQISKVENDDYYVLWYDGWKNVTKTEYKHLKNGMSTIGKQTRYKNGKWKITYQSKFGLAPHQLTVTIDAKTKQIISVETFEH